VRRARCDILSRLTALSIALLCASCTSNPGEEFGVNYAEGRCAISPDGSTVFFTAISGTAATSTSNIYSVTKDGSDITRITSGPQGVNWPWCSPDGNSILHISTSSRDQGAHVYVMDRARRRSRQLTFGDLSDIAPSYSADGSKILFARAARLRPYAFGGMTRDDWDIWQMNADGSSVRQLTYGRYYSVDPAYFSPDGAHVIFGADVKHASGLTHQILICDVTPDGSVANVRPVPFPPAPTKREFDGYPSFSPDGSTIVFTSLRVSRPAPYDYEIWTARIDGTDLHQITHNQSRNRYPVFSPDGAFIYYTGPGSVWRMKLDGSDAKKLVEIVP
jgi:Tol biopolymer transport system component